MKQLLLVILLLVSLGTQAQRTTILDTDHIHSLQLVAKENPLLPPVMNRNGWELEIGFDEMSHDYHRYRYRVEHCEADWTLSEDIFESDYLAGMNGQLIEDYEKSFNTTNIYTHYTLDLPNEYTHLLLSGNYRVTIYDEDDEENPVATTEFCLVDTKMQVGASVSGNTDIDFQRSHQQLTAAVNYGSLNITDPDRELKCYVMQNHRPETRQLITPNIKKSSGVEFSHDRELIFPGGNEYHKFDLLDVHRVNLNVDNMRWYEPYFHATLYELPPTHNYSYDEDQDGAYIIRNSEDADNETTCEYVVVHFRFKTGDPIQGGDVYVQGDWCNQWPNDDYKMTFDAATGEYHCAVLLKQGYYNYRFVQLSPDNEAIGITDRTDGNFFQTENEYQLFVYYREPGGRYDKLVGYYRSSK